MKHTPHIPIPRKAKAGFHHQRPTWLLLPSLLLLLACEMNPSTLLAENGYDLWLRYRKVEDPVLLNTYRENIRYAVFEGSAPQIEAARQEFARGISGLLGVDIPFIASVRGPGGVIAGTPESNPLLNTEEFRDRAGGLGTEGYSVFTASIGKTECIVILAREPTGVLYGVFHMLRILQTGGEISSLDITEKPLIEHRLLDHWDNLDRTVERGYAGFSIWDWHRLPEYISERYIDYARANASIGINGTVLTNVNANSYVLTDEYLEKVAALADAFRPWGIRVYLTARFSAPIELDGLQTADPLDPAVIGWWKEKAAEIYRLIPDFGGFLVKANSEGQPGPQEYNRTHADGANMLADAVGPYGGIVMWRAFVYDNNVPDDRAKQAYNEFVPLDGKFRDNVIIQVKNGPIDFQPREPFHPLFGAMPGTPLGMEFQITQEYLGQGTDLVYLAPLYKECLNADTYAMGKNSTVAKVIDGSLHNLHTSCMAGVANIGTDLNWTGHLFGQANWYAFGRLAWNHELGSGEIAGEWIRMTWTDDPVFITEVKQMMMRSREIAVQYMTPLGLHHIMAMGHHYGPGPWVSRGRADWTSVYYHRADSAGIGFDRTSTGSNALAQYSPEMNRFWSDLATCPDEYLLWFHHLSWDYPMRSGMTLWEELCRTYYSGVDSVVWMQKLWAGQKDRIDPERFDEVSAFLTIQRKQAELWRNACVLYFQSISGRPIPPGLEKPEGSLEEYMKPTFPYGPPRFRGPR
jgi:alpha-glucuronidase